MWFSRLITLLFLIACSGPLLSTNNLQQANRGYQSVVLQLKWKHQFQFAGYYAAKAKGYYRELGLEVEIREHQGRAPVEVMLEGEADYAVSGANALIKRANGYPVVALAAIYQHSPYALLVRGDSDIHRVSDLFGRRVMIGTGTQDAALHAMLKRGGLTSDEYIRLPSSFDANSLLSGETDAFNAYMTDQGFLLGQAGVVPRHIMPKDYGIDFYGDVLVTTEQRISEDPEQVENFRKATLKGWAYALANRDEVVDLILQNYNTQGMSRAHLVYEADVSKELIQPLLVEIGYMHPERWRQIHEIFIELNFLGENSRIEGLLYQAKPPIPDWCAVDDRLIAVVNYRQAAITGQATYHRADRKRAQLSNNF
ncbi:MAG: ABC transporter substrate-binding protein [Candidatus Thiodiazotropha lotti]|nr:ABC transporter substrate-binding protein [Candidatus Thiodiazotropha lotti]MCW4192222.1 ABC transporter substrate-binding protein [Candidatus Thiodiazotropha weberae]